MYIFNINTFIIPILSFIGYLFMSFTKYFTINIATNPITCLTSFYFEMLFIKKKNFFLNKIVVFISLCINIFLCIIKVHSFFMTLIFQLQGFSLLIVLIYLGEFIMNIKAKIFFNEISKLSYYIFLLHHSIIKNVFSLYNPTVWYGILEALGIIILLSVLYSKILLIILEYIFKNQTFINIESYFIKN